MPLHVGCQPPAGSHVQPRQEPECVQGQAVEQLPPSHYILTAGQLRARQFAAALYTDGQPLAPGFTETEPLGGPRPRLPVTGPARACCSGAPWLACLSA